jgi:DNA-binding transcriptional LysR family regulator
MNIHHLELFYYVARHKGVSPAARHMPYGIQQPAISSQILQLERRLGRPLFVRRPFALTEAGEQLFDFIRPFFENLPRIEESLRGDQAPQIRIGASEIIITTYLPRVLTSLRNRFPGLRVQLREGFAPELEALVWEGELDVAATVFDATLPERLNRLELARLPLELVMQSSRKLKSSTALFRSTPVQETLITLPPHEPMNKGFQAFLAAKGWEWIPGIQVGSLRQVWLYAAQGFGIGLTVRVPPALLPPELRTVPVTGAEALPVGLLWKGKPGPMLQAFVQAATAMARPLQSELQAG